MMFKITTNINNKLWLFNIKKKINKKHNDGNDNDVLCQ